VTEFILLSHVKIAYANVAVRARVPLRLNVFISFAYFLFPHFTLVDMLRDSVIQRVAYIGDNVNVSAMVEPVTTPGCVFATQSFVSILMHDDFVARPVRSATVAIVTPFHFVFVVVIVVCEVLSATLCDVICVVIERVHKSHFISLCNVTLQCRIFKFEAACEVHLSMHDDQVATAASLQRRWRGGGGGGGGGGDDKTDDAASVASSSSAAAAPDEMYTLYNLDTFDGSANVDDFFDVASVF
jgi:hypothetical protein